MLEIYSDRYYKSKIQALVNEELKNDPEFTSMSKKKQNSHQLRVYRRIRANCWENESDEVKAEIRNLFDEEHGVKDDEDDVDGDKSEAKEEVDNDVDFNGDDDEEKILLQQQQE